MLKVGFWINSQGTNVHFVDNLQNSAVEMKEVYMQGYT